jgi:hypothetical protein
MTDTGYDAGGSAGGKWGCGISALIGVPLIGFAVAVDALGDCAPDTQCTEGPVWWLIIMAILITAVVGLASRWLINRFSRRR